MGLVQQTRWFCFDTYAASLDVDASGFLQLLVFVCRSTEYSRYCLPSLSDLRTTSPHRSSLCSLHPLKPKCSMLFNQTVFTRACGELIQALSCHKEYRSLRCLKLWLLWVYCSSLVASVLSVLL